MGNRVSYTALVSYRESASTIAKNENLIILGGNHISIRLNKENKKLFLSNYRVYFLDKRISRQTKVKEVYYVS